MNTKKQMLILFVFRAILSNNLFYVLLICY